MIQKLPFTSTLMLKVPEHIYIPPFSEKSRTKKMIVRTVIEILQTRQLELLYVGFPDESFKHEEAAELTGDCTIVSINVLNAYGTMCDFNTSQDILLRKFKKELRANNEQILIDKSVTKDGFTRRYIDIYLKSHTKVPVVQPNYTFSISSGSYQTYQSGF